ncbi:Wilms tumor protein 1-interacting protein-like [Drosophila gunungcola]|uniref:Wilms tumor protein 1-interacting protein-like n=1 Tax=Drosophila gunungcola TaxID=103775 RepID=UPI0022E78B35|nr:Wilms tumor protein 1-interacting protein-like [Drosophila gunungcola]
MQARTRRRSERSLTSPLMRVDRRTRVRRRRGGVHGRGQRDAASCEGPDGLPPVEQGDGRAREDLPRADTTVGQAQGVGPHPGSAGGHCPPMGGPAGGEEGSIRRVEAEAEGRRGRGGRTEQPQPPPRAPTPPPRSPSPLPRSPSPPPRQHTVTWTWPAPEEAAEEARLREAIEAIDRQRPPPFNPRDPKAKSEKRVAETADREELKATPEEEREAQEVLEKGPWEWPSTPDTSRDAAPPPRLAWQTSCPEPRAPKTAETAVGGRGTVVGGSGGGVAGAGGQRSTTAAREAQEGQVGQAHAGRGELY